MLPTTIDPMLAHPSRTVAPTAGQAVEALVHTGMWTFELKWDGARMLAFIRDGSVRLKSREGNDITYRYPEVVEALSDAYGAGDTVLLDGEIVVYGPDGKPSFPMSHRRDAQGTARSAAGLVASMPATFMVFDILWNCDGDLRAWPYRERQALLAAECERFIPHASTIRYFPPNDDGLTLWSFVNEHALEGLVAKRKDSTYRGGRSHYWVKLKPVRSLSALVAGHRPGPGAGALEIALIDGHGLRRIGHVGSGLTPKHLDEINRRAGAGEAVVIEVQYMELSPNGQLRQPVFKGIRSDVPITDCNISQLEG